MLLAEKRIQAILTHAVLFALPTVAVSLPYLWSPAFRTGVLGFSVASYVFQAAIPNGYVNVQIVIIAWILLCGWAYFTEASSQGSLVQWSFFFANLCMFVLFGLAFFHSQWLLWATPFWVVSTFMNRRPQVFLVLDILMMLFFTAFIVEFSPRAVDQGLFGLGILKGLAAPVLGNAVPMKDFFLLQDPGIAYSALSGLMLINAVFKHPRYWLANPMQAEVPSTGLVRTRFLLGTAIFVVPATVSLIMALNSRPPFLTTAKGPVASVGAIQEGRDIRQVFLAKTATISEIQFLPGKTGNLADAQLTVQLTSPSGGQILFDQTIGADKLTDQAYYTLRLPSVSVTPGQRYVLVFEVTGATGAGYLTLYRTTENTPDASHYAIIDGTRMPYDLVLLIYGN